MAPTVRRTPYKDFLQPALHRRFSSTATILLLVSYSEALLLADWSSYFWSWFPLGSTGVRTGFLFLCGLTILILRIAQYHVGQRTASAPYQILIRDAFKFKTVETWICYGLSSALFWLVFLWSVPEKASLSLISYHSGDRARLNEKPLFLACHLGLVAIWAAVCHLYFDVDRLMVGTSNQPVTDPKSAIDLLAKKLPQLLSSALSNTMVILVVAIIGYPLLLRKFVWGWTMFFLRPFNNLPKTNLLPPSWPYDVWMLGRCMQAGVLLYMIWASGNLAFSIFMIKEPLKNGKPLTAESKDPNGSLLNGLKSKKSSVQAFAMWELSFIARDFEARRKAIFEDIDRKDGPMWSQICVICLSLIKSIETRIDEYGKPPAVPKPIEAPPTEARGRVTAPLKDDPVFQTKPAPKTMRSEVEKVIGQVARSPGHSPVAQLSPVAKKTLRSATDKLLSKEQQEALSLSSGRVSGQFHGFVLALARNEHVGPWIRHSFRGALTAAVLGTPEAEPTLYVNAVAALTLLAVHSLAEDKFGNVHRDVAGIVRTLTGLITKIEAFKKSFPVHWTDVAEDKDTPEVDLVVDAMKTGLAQVVAEFEPYSSDLRLTLKDMRMAKEAAAKPKPKEAKSAAEPVQEMEQVR